MIRECRVSIRIPPRPLIQNGSRGHMLAPPSREAAKYSTSKSCTSLLIPACKIVNTTVLAAQRLGETSVWAHAEESSVSAGTDCSTWYLLNS
jgi:hypothetical protein